MNTIVTQVRNKILKNLYEVSFIRDPAELAYEAALEKHKSHLPVLSTTERAIVETLNTEGVVVTSLEELSIPSTPQLLEAAKF
jgi:hypothetical protein